MKELMDICPAHLVDADQQNEVRSPLLDDLDLDTGPAALLRAVEAWHMLAASDRHNASQPSTDVVLDDYLAASGSWTDLTSRVFQYIHKPALVGDQSFYKPTHFKQRLATSSSRPHSYYANKDMGYRLLQHEYYSDTALQGDLASLAAGKFYWHGVTDPNYVFRPHNHGQSFVSYLRRGGMRITEWRFPGGALPEELCGSADKSEWHAIAARLVRREVEYEQGDVVWLHADEVHALRHIQGDTVTLLAELPTTRRHSVTFDEQSDGTLTPRDIFPTRGLGQISWSGEAHPPVVW